MVSWASFLGGGSGVELAPMLMNLWEALRVTATRLNFTECCLGTALKCYGHVCSPAADNGTFIKEMTVVNGQGSTGIRFIAASSISVIEDSNFIGNTNMVTIQIDTANPSKEVYVKNCRFKDNQGISGVLVEVGCLTVSGGFPTDGSCIGSSSEHFVLENCQIEAKNPEAYGSHALSSGVETDQFQFSKDQIQTLHFDYHIKGRCEPQSETFTEVLTETPTEASTEVHPSSSAQLTQSPTPTQSVTPTQSKRNTPSETDRGNDTSDREKESDNDIHIFSDSELETNETEKEVPSVGAIVGGTVGAASALGGGAAAAFMLKRKFGSVIGQADKIDGIGVDLDPDNGPSNSDDDEDNDRGFGIS
jgi:hypothetical protein